MPYSPEEWRRRRRRRDVALKCMWLALAVLIGVIPVAWVRVLLLVVVFAVAYYEG